MLAKLDTKPSLEQIQQVHSSIKPFIHQTPVLQSESLNKIAGCSLYFKCENFQKVGAFKMRGAISAALALTEEERKNGLATHSSGNHAQAVAKTAQILGIPAHIVMPNNAPAIKKAAVRGYGATITECEPTTFARESMMEKVVAQTGAYFIHPYNDFNVMAGQATAALELINTVDNLDILMAPIGGGGLMSGTALLVNYLLPNAQAIAAEPMEVDDAYQSVKAGYIIENKTTNSIADGLRTTIREKTFGVLREYVHEIIRVEESEIIEAMRYIWERMKIIIEPSSAVPLAAVLQQKEKFANKQVGMVLTGGNVDLSKLPF